MRRPWRAGSSADGREGRILWKLCRHLTGTRKGWSRVRVRFSVKRGLPGSGLEGEYRLWRGSHWRAVLRKTWDRIWFSGRRALRNPSSGSEHWGLRAHSALRPRALDALACPAQTTPENAESGKRAERAASPARAIRCGASGKPAHSPTRTVLIGYLIQ